MLIKHITDYKCSDHLLKEARQIPTGPLKTDNTLFDIVGHLVSFVYFRETKKTNKHKRFSRPANEHIPIKFGSNWLSGFREED